MLLKSRNKLLEKRIEETESALNSPVPMHPGANMTDMMMFRMVLENQVAIMNNLIEINKDLKVL
jgi:hypothetical protein